MRYVTDPELEAGCLLARKYDIASVCMKPYWLQRCAELLAGNTVQPSTVIGFPHSGHTVRIKLAETEQALRDGGTELDMVVNIGNLLSDDWRYVSDEIQSIAEMTLADKPIPKVMFENCFLHYAHKLRLCGICGDAGADFVKTWTGYGSGGITIPDLPLVHLHSPARVQVKAAGGVRSLAQLLEARAVEVARCGATRTAKILDECKRRLASAPLGAAAEDAHA